MTSAGRRPFGDPIPLRRSLDALRADLELPSTDLLAEIAALWDSVVPAELTAHSRIRGLRARRLTVDATAAAAGQLRYLERAVIEEVSKRLGPGVVEQMSVVVVASLDDDTTTPK